MTQQETLKRVLHKLDRLDSRLIGRRPHPNDIEWVKQIADDIRGLIQGALKGLPERKQTP